MRKIKLFAVAAALILAGVGAWATSTTQARVAAPAPPQIDPFQLMLNAPKDLPVQNGLFPLNN